MSHFAEVDKDNKVIRVLVGNPELTDSEGLIEIQNLLGGTWLRTSYNAAQNGFRGNYAGVGYTYYEDVDLFMSPVCHAEAILNSVSAQWDCTNEEHDVNPLAD